MAESPTWEIRQGDALARLREMPDGSVQCCITSPPYWGLRDYGIDGQIGLEASAEEFVAKLVEVFHELWRVLCDDGTLWLNLGDTYADRANSRAADGGASRRRDRAAVLPPKRGLSGGLKQRDLVGIPWMTAFALRADGWYLRSEVIWAKPTPLPESVTNRPTVAHEQVFLLTKAPTGYHYDADAIRTPLAAKTLTTYGTRRERHGGGSLVKADNWARDVPERKARLDAHGRPVGANKRSVWTVSSESYADAHFATFPQKLVEPMILAGCPVGGLVLDPFAGAATVALVALRLGRSFVGIELSPEYVEMARRRIVDDSPLLNDAAEVAA